jgi:hypothetical protein
MEKLHNAWLALRGVIAKELLQTDYDVPRDTFFSTNELHLRLQNMDPRPEWWSTYRNISTIDVNDPSNDIIDSCSFELPNELDYELASSRSGLKSIGIVVSHMSLL